MLLEGVDRLHTIMLGALKLREMGGRQAVCDADTNSGTVHNFLNGTASSPDLVITTRMLACISRTLAPARPRSPDSEKWW